ncbi:MAG: WG repeat-containing protein [Phycisphaerales bacterium JB047]
MRKLFRKHRKLKITILIVLTLFSIYLAHITLIHYSNSRHDRIWDEIVDHAIANGIAYKPTRDPSIDRVHFYDDSSTYRSRSGLTRKYQGYRDSSGEVILPAIYKWADKEFCEGLAYVVMPDGNGAFIHPDGSVAFKANYDHVSPFVNGMAQVRNELSSNLITPQIRTGYINHEGMLVIPIENKNSNGSDFTGDYVLIAKRTIYSPIYDTLMDGIDVSLGFHWFFPNKLYFFDKQGKRVSPAKVRRSFK